MAHSDMPSVWSKLDVGLSLIYAKYLRVRDHGPDARLPVHPIVEAGGRVHIVLNYSGDLRQIEAAGFETVQDDGNGRASGVINLSDLEALAAQPGVVKLSYGTEPRVSLNKSIPNVKADKVWMRSSQGFAGMTGEGVIVGIIDTGIDYTHRFFYKTKDVLKPPLVNPVPETRILRIWDQSLDPVGDDEKSPSADAIGYVNPYGVEYTAETINAVLQSPGPLVLRHTNADGHGTHVASIAAGNGRDGFVYIGVAPEADLVVVKFLSLIEQPAGLQARPSINDMFQHAVNYILNLAANPPGSPTSKPVVINCSFGSQLGPHDGFNAWEIFLTQTFSSANGRVCVVGAGNDKGKKHHAAIQLPNVIPQPNAPASITETVSIPFEVKEARAKVTSEDLTIALYYPAKGVALSIEVSFPGAQAAVAAPAFNEAAVAGFFKGNRSYTMTHSSENDVLPDGNLVSRKLFTLMIEPLLDAGHAQGTYSLKIIYTVTADAPLADHNRAHLWCKYINKDCGFEVGAIDQQLFPNVSAEDRFLINPPAGADYTIAVAAYDPRDDPNFAVAGFSSSGPLANYGSGVQPPPKPDLAAPGVKIHAACSRDYHPLEPTLEYLGASTTVLHGTSMAAPHVTGAVALILQKDPNASAKAVDAYLKLGATTYPQPQPEQAGVGRLDAKETFDVAP